MTWASLAALVVFSVSLVGSAPGTEAAFGTSYQRRALQLRAPAILKFNEVRSSPDLYFVSSKWHLTPSILPDMQSLPRPPRTSLRPETRPDMRYP